MDCLFCLASLFIQADTGYQHIRDEARPGHYWKYDRNAGSPILSALSVGFEGNLTNNVIMEVKVRHESMPTIREDRGVNAVWVTAKWYPFK